MVGRTPWSAAGLLAGLIRGGILPHPLNPGEPSKPFSITTLFIFYL
jgi:hypothetical protein